MDLRTYALLLLLLIPAATALSTDAKIYAQGDHIHIASEGPINITTPAGDRYTLLGKGQSTFAATQTGTYLFEEAGEAVLAHVAPAQELTLQTASADQQVRAADTGDELQLRTGDIAVTLQRFSGSTIRVSANPNRQWGFLRGYAVDPTTPGFDTAIISKVAQGSTLYKCTEYNYTTEECWGSWSYVRGLTPGERYSITVSDVDPAFGESDAESEPDSCTYSDEPGVGDGDSNVDCLSEAKTQDSGTSADLEDEEGSGVPSQINTTFNNTLSIASINSINVTYRYMRSSSATAGQTTADIQLMDNASWVSACTDTVTEGAWENVTCDLSSWVTTQAEANNVQTRIQFSTNDDLLSGDVVTVWVDYSHLALDYVYNDVFAPTYSNVTASPQSPTTYDGKPSNFSAEWQDDDALDTVRIEHNFTGALTNETVTGGQTYQHTATLSAGSYQWRMHANDTSGNTNTTPWQSYSVQRAPASIQAVLNGTNDSTAHPEDTPILLEARLLAGEGVIELLEDDQVLTAGPANQSTTKTYAEPGTYTIQARHNQTQNYTYAQQNHTLTITDETAPALTLREPYNGKTLALATNTFSYEPDDNVATKNCTFILDSADNGTDTSISEEETNNFTRTLTNGNYTWAVRCADAAGNNATSTTRNFTVDIIDPWIPTNATHSTDGTVTGLVNESDNTISVLEAAEQVDATAWSSSAPADANITEVDASCELDSATGGATTYFQYSTGSGFSGDECATPENGTGTFSCDLYALGVDTINELNNLQVRCVVRDADGGTSASADLDYMQVQPGWTLIEKPNFRVHNITPPETTEGRTADIAVVVNNTGVVGADVVVRVRDETRAELIDEQTVTVSSGSSEQVNASWEAVIGRTNISVILDPADNVDEANETDNEAWTYADISAWQTYYGLTKNRFKALAKEAAITFNWTNDALRGNIYATDADASVTMLNLQALTRAPNGSYFFADLAEADAHLNMTGWTDSINSTYSNAGELVQTRTIEVFGENITDVPVTNSTNTSAFQTGVLYDADDDTNGGYDGEEDLVFVTFINRSQTGRYGVADYELAVPALLRDDTVGASSVDLFVEIR